MANSNLNKAKKAKQFEIVKFRKGNDNRDLRFLNGKSPYFRILIQHKNTDSKE